MAIYPGAKQLLIPPGSNDPRINARVGILHVDAGDNESLHRYFNGPSGGVESHFHIPKFKQVEQYRDTAFEADANHLANPFAISVETQGLAHEEWTDHQLDEIKDLMIWADAVDDIPLKECMSWDGEGWGYHVKFGTPGWWTPTVKSCPGPRRIEQFHDLLVPWMKEQDSMAFTQKDREELLALRTELAALTEKVVRKNANDTKRFRELRNLVKSILDR